MATAEATVRTAAPVRRRDAGLWSTAWYRLRKDRLTIIAAIVLLVFIVLALLADVLAQNLFHRTYTQQDLLNNYQKPTFTDPALWFGSDEIGRSQIVRLLYGARVSLAVGFGAAFINLTLGIVVGLSMGYFRGWFDDLMQFVVTTLNAIPGLYLLLIVAVFFGPSPLALVLLLGSLNWPNNALYVRGQTLSLRERDFVTAARVIGVDSLTIMFRHILRNVLPLVFIVSAIDVGQLILTESALSFLGLGIQQPLPSWGNMLTHAAQDITRGPWLVVAPGAAIFATVLCLYLLGDGLRDALDPRLKEA
jgi:peptide/nickel transport system permease protein